jgi:outer membrane protein OmpA-like peptidoglycan-associated protein
LQDSWKITHLKDISTPLDDGIAGVSIDGLKLFINIGGNNIYVFYKDLLKDQSVFVPIKKYCGINLPKYAFISSVAMSGDEKTFYIASDMPGGKGGFDIWKTEYNEMTNKWSDWQNLDSVINSVGDEYTISISGDESALYVSSNGHGGMGGSDIFRIDRIDGVWSNELVNLGAPINTAGNDLFYSSVGGTAYQAYYCSESADSSRDFDIYYVNYKEPVLCESERAKLLKIAAVKHRDPDPIDEFIPVESEKRRAMQSALNLVAANREYGISHRDVFDDDKAWQNSAAEKYGVSSRDVFSNKEYGISRRSIPDSRLYKDLAVAVEQAAGDTGVCGDSVDKVFRDKYGNVLAKLGYTTEAAAVVKPKTGDRIYCQNIVFEKGKSELAPSSYLNLKKICEFLQSFPDVVIEIGGHTSSEGSYEFNQKLSKARADAVKNYLLKSGISASRLQTHGYGYSMPVEDEGVSLGKVLNRRVEIVVVK